MGGPARPLGRASPYLCSFREVGCPSELPHGAASGYFPLDLGLQGGPGRKMKLPICSSKKVERALSRAGFNLVRSSGSHGAYQKRLPNGRLLTATVPLGKREIPRGTLASILRQAELSVEEFLSLAKLIRRRRRGR